MAIPLTLRDSLMARLDRFAPVKEVAQIGAAIGREFSWELIAAVAPHARPAPSMISMGYYPFLTNLESGSSILLANLVMASRARRSRLIARV